MLERSQNSYFLLKQFREFYAEVGRLRRVVTTNPPSEKSVLTAAHSSGAKSALLRTSSAAAPPNAASVAIAPENLSATDIAEDENEDETTIRIWEEMAAYLDQKMYDVKLSASSISHGYLEELTYIMAAFADESFLCLLDWSGKGYWRDNLMELRLFRSQIAGQEIFKRIDKVLVRADHGAEELCAVYLMVLALGFKGRYWNDPEAIDIYRRELFDRLLMTNPDLRQDSRHLIHEAYRHTVSEGAPVSLPEPRKWWLVVAVILGVWLTLSSVAWWLLTRPTRELLTVTGQSLNRITGQHQVMESSSKWTELQFSLEGGAFRLELPSSLPFTKPASGAKGAVMEPLLIAVNGPNGMSPGSPAQVKTWLSSGSTIFQSTIAGAAPNSHAVASVEQITAPPGGVTANSTTLFFAVDTAVGPQELSLHPQLVFSANRENGTAVQAVTLCLPDKSTASLQ